MRPRRSTPSSLLFAFRPFWPFPRSLPGDVAVTGSWRPSRRTASDRPQRPTSRTSSTASHWLTVGAVEKVRVGPSLLVAGCRDV